MRNIRRDRKAGLNKKLKSMQLHRLLASRIERMKGLFPSPLHIRFCFLAVGALGSVLTAACGTDSNEEWWDSPITLEAWDIKYEESFGITTAIDGKDGKAVIIMGAAEGNVERVAFIFRHDGRRWTKEAKLMASDAKELNYFGCSLAIYDDVALVGAIRNDDEKGAVYVYRRKSSHWTEEAKLIGSDSVSGDWFGYSCAIYENVALLSAANADDASGAVYIFRHNGKRWIEEAKLMHPDPQPRDFFGGSLALYGNTAIIGKPGDRVENDIDGKYRQPQYGGSAYIYRYDGTSWNMEARFHPPELDKWDLFGGSVSIHGDVAVVGSDRAAVGDDLNAGAAYVYRFDGKEWIPDGTLTASEGPGNANFGVSVSIRGNTTLVGACVNPNVSQPRPGSAHLFRHDGERWIALERLEANDKAESSLYGTSVALGDELAVVGAASWNGEDKAKAFVFDFPQVESGTGLGHKEDI